MLWCNQVKTGKPDSHFCSKFVSDSEFVSSFSYCSSEKTILYYLTLIVAIFSTSNFPPIHTVALLLICSSILLADRRLMGSISHAIGPKVGFHHQVSHCSHGLFGLNSDKVFSLCSRKQSGRIRASVDVKDGRKNTAIDFSDPDWKLKYQADFEKRFNLPRITDVFGDAVPIPSTFCLKMRWCSLCFAFGCVLRFLL